MVKDKDSTHFLQILENLGPLPDNCLLVTLDVNSLYTNIDITEGSHAVEVNLDIHRPGGDVKPCNETILNLLKLVLTRNNFKFTGQNYLQIKGVSMGSRVSPSLAILYMGAFEDRFVYTYHLQPLVYGRYIDDIFMIWPHSLEELKKFIKYLNDCTANIQFSQDISETEINFLDIKIRLVDGKLSTTLYTKPTDAHDYVYYSSAHPQRCKDSIPYSQFLRLRRICSNIEDFDLNVLLLGKHFLKRNYPIELIESAALLARRKDRHVLLQDNQNDTKTEEDRIFLITRYNPNDSSLKDIIFQNWDILGTSTTTSHVFKKKLMIGYRRPKNLRDLLVRADIPPLPEDEGFQNKPNKVDKTSTDPLPPPNNQLASKQTTLDSFITRTSRTEPTPSTSNTPTSKSKRQGTSSKERGFNFCNNPLCKYCKLLNKTGSIISHSTHSQYNTMQNISCRSSNVIYCITCKVCGKQYVGQTLRKIRDRLSEHLRDMDKADRTKPLGLHFTTHEDHPIEVHILEFIKKPPRSPQALTIRNRVEKRWIHLLRTPTPLGLNLED